MKKLIVGTAQLVKNYGITNYNKKKNKKNFFEFLEFCVENSLYSFDAAFNYGSEKVIGEFIKKNNVKNFKVSTKIPSLKFLKSNQKIDFIDRKIDLSINNLSYLDTVYFHDENDLNFFKSNQSQIINLFKKYKIKKLGFSIYSKHVLKSLIKNKNIDSIQLPLNIVNKDFCKIKTKKNIVARSIFLQGLLINSKIKSQNSILKNFNKKIFKLSNEKKIDLYSLCLNYVLQNDGINKIVIGFDDIAQLKKILKFKKSHANANEIKLINSLFLSKDYNKIKDPRKW